jgi:allantoicase
VRLNIYPDGGVARLRVHGEVKADLSRLRASSGLVDLAAMENGGVVALCNDNFFGKKDNLILPGTSTHMGDGWETRRRRSPGNDWTIVRLAAPGTLRRVELDTTHFKGNFPDTFALDGARLPADAPTDLLSSRTVAWEPVLPQLKLRAHATHTYEKELIAEGPFTHVRLSIFPDGGVARLRLYGRPA